MASTRIVPDEPIIDVIGASQYHLRVITLAGEVVFEKAISELRSLGLEDIVDNVSRSMGVLPHRLSLLCLFLLIASFLFFFFSALRFFENHDLIFGKLQRSDNERRSPTNGGLERRESPKMLHFNSGPKMIKNMPKIV